MIDKNSLEKASRFYNINYKILPNNKISITYKGDSWLVCYDNKRIKLYHKNLFRNKTHKCKYHHQRDFKDVWYMLRYIKEHKRNYGELRKLDRVNRLLNKLNSNVAMNKQTNK